MKKSFITILLIFSICIMLSMVDKAYAEDVIDSGSCGNNVNWTLTGTDTDMVLTINGTGAMQDFSESSIPWATRRSKIKEVVVEEGITYVGAYAFYSLNKATDFSLPNSLRTIGGHSFANNVSLATITIPNKVTSIGSSAFQDCSRLTSIIIPDGVRYINDDTFHGCSSLTSITIPDSVTSIRSGAFYGCSSLTSVVIPEGVTEISMDTFFGCTALTSITIPYSVTSIGSHAFRNCSSLTTITIPDGVPKIGYYTFYGCSSLTSITIPDSVTSVDNYAFYGCRSLTSITIPDSVVSIGNYAFYSCTNLTCIEIPDSVMSIGNNAFVGCYSLSEVIYAGTREQLDSLYAFSSTVNIICLKETFNITYYLNGGTNSPDNPLTYTFEDTVILKNPTKDNSVFEGWYSDVDFTTKVTGLPKGSYGDKGFYAKWSWETFNIIYHLDGGTNSPDNPLIYTIEDTVTFKNPTRDNSVFEGWYTDASFTTPVTGIPKGSTGDKDLYAKWREVETYNITYHLDGGTNSPDNPATYTSEDTVTLKDPNKANSTFEGWYSDDDFTTQVTSIPKGSSGNKDFYAKWSLKSFSITYHLYGGTNSPYNPEAYTSEDAVTLRNPTKVNSIFEGWYSDARFTTRVTGIPKGSSGDKDFYAKWDIKTYNISYYLNGGTNSPENPDSYTSEDVVTLKNPTKTGATFEGWFSDASFSLLVSEIPKGSTGDKAFYAKWATQKYSITYYLNGGINSSGNPKTYSSEYTVELQDPTKVGCFFEGWYTDASFSTRVTEIPQGSTGNKKLYAKWIDAETYVCEYIEEIGEDETYQLSKTTVDANWTETIQIGANSSNKLFFAYTAEKDNGDYLMVLMNSLGEDARMYISYRIEEDTPRYRIFSFSAESDFNSELYHIGDAFNLDFITHNPYYDDEYTEKVAYQYTPGFFATAVDAWNELLEEKTGYTLIDVGMRSLYLKANRIFGNDRYTTSRKVADELKASLGINRFDTIILANGKNYPDALAGSYLSCLLDAPILLVDSSQAQISAVQKYIKANLNPGGQIYILGGPAVVPDKAVSGLGRYKATRLGGKDRYETNLQILQEAAKYTDDEDHEIIVCTGTGFADSLSAAAVGKPILLVGKTLKENQTDYLRSLDGDTVFDIIGGTGAVSQKIENILYNEYGMVNRISGKDRYETSANVAKWFYDKPSLGVLAYGKNFPDGLCGGALAYNYNGPLILTTDGNAKAAVNYAKEASMGSGYVLGGPSLISDDSARAVFHMNKSIEIVVK